MNAEAEEISRAGEADESVLRLRLAILRRNLEQVRDTAGCVAHRRKEIQELQEVFEETEGIQAKAFWMADDVASCQRTVDQLRRVPGFPKETVDRLGTFLSRCSGLADEFKEKADKSAKIITAMARRWSNLSADEVFDSHVREIFAVKAGKLLDVIEGLTADPPHVAWQTYQTSIRVAAEDLFSEYVEFLSGLALRDTGLACALVTAADAAGDEQAPGAEDGLASDVYVMADDLIKQIYRIGQAELWHSLTIPARRDLAARTVARMIRLGFPEWTIWAVPLSAYEFGRVVVEEKKDDISEQAASHGEPLSSGFEIVLADAFATYALGPAYAFASVYVLLDPSTGGRSGGQERRADSALRGDSDRAFVVLRMLELMNEGKALDDVIGTLRNRWSAAVEQADGAPPPAGQAAESLKWQAARIWHFLEENASGIRYGARRWVSATRWDPLASLAAGRSWKLQPGQEDVRDILNAAWYQRIQAWTPPDPPPDHQLADAALALWRRDLAARRRRSNRGMM